MSLRATPDGLAVVREIPPPASDSTVIPRLDKGPAAEVATLPPDFFGDPRFLGFAGGIFRPPEGERLDPRLAARLTRREAKSEVAGLAYGYLIFEERASPRVLDSVRALGVEILFPHPNNAVAAKLPLATLLEVAHHPSVRWAGYALPSLKLHPILVALLSASASGDEIPVWVSLFESDLGKQSLRIGGPLPVVTGPNGTLVTAGDTAAAWRWEARGPMQQLLEETGLRILGYREEIHAFEAVGSPSAILAASGLERVAFVEARPEAVRFHDRVVPMLGQDYSREVYPASTVTVGVIDSGFHTQNGGYSGHLDLLKQAVAWDHWPGACGSPYCDEPPDYHGTHVLGTICGTGTVINALRGTSPYLGDFGADHRLFLVKGFTSAGYAHMRQPYTDPWGSTTPRPVLVNNSWGFKGCINSCTDPANFIGSEAECRLADDEVYQQNQLYLFAAGNEGEVGGGRSVAGTIGVPAAAKNVLTVGMTRSGFHPVTLEEAGSIVTWSSAGPCGDGRWKPNVVAPGCVTVSTLGGTTNQYESSCGTSMSSPAAAGVLAGVAQGNPTFSASAPLARAWAMATAVTWQDQGSAWLGGWFPNAHLNTYGMGRVSALKAHYGGGSLPWTRSWAYSTVTGETDTFDLTVGATTTRLIVVLTWDDPQAAPGANPARVSDVDLYLDRYPFDAAGNVGEYWSASGPQTVEHIVLDAPPPGDYRIKVFPYANPGTVRWGCMAIQLFGDTTPSGNVTVEADVLRLRPGDPLNLTVTASCDDAIGSNVYLQLDAHAGLTLTGTKTTLKDGQLLINRHLPAGEYTLGDILGGDARSMVYSFTADPGDGQRTAYFQRRSDNMGAFFAARTVVVDGTPPLAPSGLVSTTHTPNVWSNSRVLGFTWTQPPDPSGIAGFADAVSETLPVPVPFTRTLPNLQFSTTTLGFDTNGVHYGLRTEDGVGNWSGVTSVGPFRADTIAPTSPTGLTSTSHLPWVWTNNGTVTLSWGPALDERSGVDGYGISATPSAPAYPPQTATIGGSATSTTTTLATAGLGYYLNLAAKDAAGNWSAGYASAGPYFIDTVAPTAPGSLHSTTHPLNGWSTSTNPTMAWTPATDAHSGLAGYVTLWDHSAATVPSGAVDTPAGATSKTASITTSSAPWYFHLRARDGAGSYSATLHQGPYYVDGAVPSGPTALGSSTHPLGGWSNATTLAMSWTAATDSGAGLAGYLSAVNQSPTTVLTGTPDTLPAVTAKTFTISSSAGGWYVHLRAKDLAGNYGPQVHAGPYFVDTIAPTGVALVINGGATQTTLLAVTLGITASDTPSGLASMRFRNDGGVFSAWEPYATTKAWNLTNSGGSSATGTRTVILEVRDQAGNIGTAYRAIYRHVAVTYFGTAASGILGPPNLVVSGIVGLGQSLTIEVLNTAAPQLLLFAGISTTSWLGIPLPLDLTPSGYPGSIVYIAPELELWNGPPMPLHLTLPPDPTYAGLTVHLQGILLGDPSGHPGVTTRAATLTIAGL